MLYTQLDVDKSYWRFRISANPLKISFIYLKPYFQLIWNKDLIC